MHNVSFWGLSRGMRLRIGGDQRRLVNTLAAIAQENGFTEILLPTVEPQEVYQKAFGEAQASLMWTFKDKKGRDVCLRPEGTGTLQGLYSDTLKYEHDAMVFYEARCFRYERPQLGRYREFTQFGVEVMNPTKDHHDFLISLSKTMIAASGIDAFELAERVERGLGYYTEHGWEISIPSLGAQKQVLGGGRYKEGIGFAIGIDRLLLAMEKEK